MRAFDYNHKVLVLNKSCIAINVVTLRRAMRLLFAYEKPVKDYRGCEIKAAEPKAKIIDPADFGRYTWEDWAELKPKDGELSFGAGQSRYRLPSIIVLSQHDKIPPLRSNFSRKKIYERDEYMCQYCGSKPGSSELSIDHVVPKCQGGLTTWENIVLACVKCNSKKAGRTPTEANMRLARKPFKPKVSGLLKARIPDEWVPFVPENFDALVSECYWKTELVNDN